MARGDHIFARGKRIWCCIKDIDGKWINLPSPYNVGDEDLAIRFAKAIWDGLHGEELAPPAPSRPKGQARRRREVAVTIDYEIDGDEEIDGTIYAISLLPKELPLRIKVGYTSLEMFKRMSPYRTSCPDAMVLGCWRGSRGLEKRVLRALPGRIETSEVFDVPSVSHALMIIDSILGSRIKMN